MLKIFTIFSYTSIGLVTVFLILMLAKIIPVDWFLYILGFSIFLLLIRIAFRIYIVLQSRKNKE